MQPNNHENEVFWFKMVDDIGPLMDLKPLELRVYLVIVRAIQRDQSKGLISLRQIKARAHSGTLGRIQEAVNALCQKGFFARHDKHTGDLLTHPEQWRSRGIEYRLPYEWWRRDSSARGEQNCSARGKQHLDPSESTPRNNASLSRGRLDSDRGSNKESNWGRTQKADCPNPSAKSAEDSGHRVECAAHSSGDTVRPLWINDVAHQLSNFMDGEPPPDKLISWVVTFVDQYKLSPSEVLNALQSAWRRTQRRRRNGPRGWNWFYEVLRNALQPIYATRLPEGSAAQSPEVSTDHDFESLPF
jgi:hypothetical protein